MPAKVTLAIQGGAWDGKEYEFAEPARCVIGRSEDCTVQLPNRGWEFCMVSRHHCRLDIDPPRVRVRDLGSRNGTYLNGWLIGLRGRDESPNSAADLAYRAYDLHEGDILEIGPVHFRVQVSEVEAPRAAPVAASANLGTPEAEGTAEPPAEQIMVAI